MRRIRLGGTVDGREGATGRKTWRGSRRSSRGSLLGPERGESHQPGAGRGPARPSSRKAPLRPVRSAAPGSRNRKPWSAGGASWVRRIAREIHARTHRLSALRRAATGERACPSGKADDRFGLQSATFVTRCLRPVHRAPGWNLLPHQPRITRCDRVRDCATVWKNLQKRA